MNSTSKIKSANQLKKILAQLRKRSKKQKIVFTNGCFDLIHRGHVTYLEKAKKLGTVLVVALNSDDSVRRLNKGPGRPINTLEDRARVMAALGCVDYVTWFQEDTPLKIISELMPQVLVKGGDWKPAQIVGADVVQAVGGKVKSIPYVAGKSTTDIIQKVTKSSQ